jgi:stage II sporulation protein AA (anti-sigma F factor antagonist)
LKQGFQREIVLLEIKTEETGGCFVVFPKGELNAQSCAALQSVLMEEISNGRHKLVICLTELSFIASAGLRVLLIVARRMAAVKGKVSLIEGSAEIMEVLEISGVKTLIPVYSSVDTAVQSSD